MGPAWRTKEVACWLLNRSIITMADITHGISCTCRLPPGYLMEALEKVDAAWGESEKRKLGINSMIGLWQNPRQYSYQAKTHEGLDDVLFEGAKAERVLEEFGLREVVMRFEQVSNQTMSLIHRQIIDAEALLLARLAADLRQTISARALKECRVDSIVIAAGRKKEVLCRVQQLTYADMGLSSRRCFRAHPIPGDDPVLLKGNIKLPTVNAAPPVPCVDWT